MGLRVLSYMSVVVMAASSYLIALAMIHALAARLEPAITGC